MYPRERERESSKTWLWIILVLVLGGGVGAGVYFFTQQNSSENPQEDQSHQEKKAKEKMLEKYQVYFTEQDLPSLISQISYLGDQYSASTFEEIADRNLEIFKKKDDKLFTQFPTNTQDFKDKYEEAEKKKIKFLYVSLIPRKSDGKVDWIKWKEQQEKEDKLLKSEEIKNYLENKTNSSLKNWYDNLKSDPDPVKRLNLIDQQVREHLNFQMIGWWLHKIGKEKGWIDKEYSKGLKPSFKDASGNQISIDFDLVTEYDLSNWIV